MKWAIIGVLAVSFVIVAIQGEQQRGRGAHQVRPSRVSMSKAVVGDRIVMKPDRIGCATQQQISDMAGFATSGDKTSFSAYLLSGRCKVFKGGESGTKAEASMLGLEARVVIDGRSYWTTGDAYSP